METGTIEVSQSAREDIKDRMIRLEKALEAWRNSSFADANIENLKFEIIVAASALHGYLKGYGI